MAAAATAFWKPYLLLIYIGAQVIEPLLMPAAVPGGSRWYRGADEVWQELYLVGRLRGGVWAVVYPDRSVRAQGLNSGRIRTAVPEGESYIGSPADADVIAAEYVDWIPNMLEDLDAGLLEPGAPWVIPAGAVPGGAVVSADAGVGLTDAHHPSAPAPAPLPPPPAPPTSRRSWFRNRLRDARRIPRRIWAVTKPLGSNFTRGLALCVGGITTYRAGSSLGQRLGLFAFIASFIDESFETYEQFRWAVDGAVIVIETLQEGMEEAKSFAYENPTFAILIALLIMSWVRGADAAPAPVAAPAAAVHFPPPRGDPRPPPPPPPRSRADDSGRDVLVANLLDEQRGLRRQIDDLQDQLARGAGGAPSSGDGAPPAPAGARADEGAGSPDILKEMMDRLGRMESVIRADAGRGGAAAGSPDELISGAGGSPTKSSMADVLARLERSTRPPHQAFLDQLRQYRDIPASQWPMPPGYTQRLAPAYLANVYREGTGIMYARRWLRDHELTRNVPAQEMLSIMEAVDDAVLSDGTDVINSIAFEKLVRRAYGLERAFEDVQKEVDWKRPDGKKNWSSKVKWDLCDRYDVRNFNQRAARVPLVDEEARQSMERDAAFHKWYTKSSSAARAGAAGDE